MSSGDESPARPAAPGNTPEPIVSIRLGEEEITAIDSLMSRLVSEFPDLEFERDLARLAVLCHELPESVRTTLIRFRLLNEPSGGFVLSGLPIDLDRIGPTPQTHEAIEFTDEVRRATGLHLLLASVLGAPISQAAVREGRMIVDVCPLPGDENTQLATSSTGGLTWHNEDAHHDLRADWILLMCLRNPDRVPTTFARVNDLRLPSDVTKKLYDECFTVVPDSSHLGGAGISLKVAVLSGDRRSPFVRVDPAFMPRELQEDDAAGPLDAIVKALDDNLQDVVLQPGDVMVIDNRRTVHGRRPFTPRFDGTDRWLRVMNVAADLRPSEGQRTGSHGRAIKPFYG